jgi:hypothetical protein
MLISLEPCGLALRESAVDELQPMFISLEPCGSWSRWWWTAAYVHIPGALWVSPVGVRAVDGELQPMLLFLEPCGSQSRWWWTATYVHIPGSLWACMARYRDGFTLFRAFYVVFIVCPVLYMYVCVLWFFERSVCLCGLVVKIPGYRSRGPGFDSQRYQIFWQVIALERGPLSLVIITEELLERKVVASVKETRLTAVEIRCTDHAAPSTRKSLQ